MGEMRPLPVQPPGDAWICSAVLLERWLAQRGRLDSLMEAGDFAAVRRGKAQGAGRPAGSAGGGAAMAGGQERARCQHLLFGAVRNLGRLEALFGGMIRQRPRGRLRAALLVAGFELLEAGAEPVEAGREARIVHHAVAQAKRMLSPAEARLVNAVLRKVASAPGLHSAPPPEGAGRRSWRVFIPTPNGSCGAGWRSLALTPPAGCSIGIRCPRPSTPVGGAIGSIRRGFFSLPAGPDSSPSRRAIGRRSNACWRKACFTCRTPRR